MSYETLFVVGVALIGFLLGWLAPMRVVWIIGPMIVLSITFVIAASDTELAAAFVLYAFVYSVSWSLVVLVGRGFRRVMRS